MGCRGGIFTLKSIDIREETVVKFVKACVRCESPDYAVQQISTKVRLGFMKRGLFFIVFIDVWYRRLTFIFLSLNDTVEQSGGSLGECRGVRLVGGALRV